jgi:BASS family bile acid:Na+ symporter
MHHGIVTRTDITIKILTCSALVGLLGAVGLRLTWQEVRAALVRCNATAIVAINFLVVPGLVVAAAKVFRLERDTTVAMVLLAATPFAPVVPVFARLARADLALAAGLTASFPIVSVILTPLVARTSMALLSETGALHFNMLVSLVTLAATISLPLAVGVLLRHYAPNAGRRLLRPVELLSEATGAASLAFVTVTEFSSITNLGWRAWVAMGILFEVSVLIGWLLGGDNRGSRQVIALGTSNRNIALALLIAVQSFPGTPIIAGVVGNGLLLIGLGLLHVGWWRLADMRRSPADSPGRATRN